VWHCLLIRKRKNAAKLTADRNANHEQRPDFEFMQSAEFPLGLINSRQRIVDFDHLTVAEALHEPGPVTQIFVVQNFGTATRETGLIANYALDVGSVWTKRAEKCAVDAHRFRQLTDIFEQLFGATLRIEVLQVNGDLGLQRIDATAIACAGAWPALPHGPVL
jgi:hypothetical protein